MKMWPLQGKTNLSKTQYFCMNKVSDLSLQLRCTFYNYAKNASLASARN